MFSEEERTWGMLAHVITLAVNAFTGMGFIAAIVIYFTWREKSKFVAFHALQALLVCLASVVLAIISIVAVLTIIGIPVAIAIWVAIWIGGIVVPCICGIRAQRGELYTLPVIGPIARNAVGI